MPLIPNRTETGEFYLSIEKQGKCKRYIYLRETATSVEVVDDHTFIVHTEYSGSMEYKIYGGNKVSSPKPIRAGA